MAHRRLSTVSQHLLGSWGDTHSQFTTAGAGAAAGGAPAAARVEAEQAAALPKLFDDEQMMDFIREGYVMFRLDDLPRSYHDGIVEKLDSVIEKHGNPGNNMLPMVPDLMTMLKHPVVDGALQSILGTDYYIHLHRHVHNLKDSNVDEGAPGGVKRLHKDSLGNSRFCVDNKRRQHRARMCMLMYFPQDTPMELGPTAVMPRAQYLLHQPQVGEASHPALGDQRPVHCAGPAGTVAIVHYDMLHCASNKVLPETRHMVKFLFSRLTEPSVSGPTWAHTGSDWQGSGDSQEPIWRMQWDWHCGQSDKPSATDNDVDVRALATQLQSNIEMEAVAAAYNLAIAQPQEASVHVLMEALQELPIQFSNDPLDLNPAMNDIRADYFKSEGFTQAGYGLTELGAAAVPALIQAASSDTPLIRSRAIDVLGDIGPAAAAALPMLVEALTMEQHVDPRRRAAEAIGTVGCGAPEQARLCAELANMLTDTEEQVRRNAAYSLARLGTAIEPGTVEENAVVTPLRAALTDEYHYVRGLAALALERIGTPAAMNAALSQLQVARFD